VHAFERGERFAEPVLDARTVASGLRVPRAVADFLILDALRRCGGAARAAPEAELGPWMRRVSAREGVGLCPESAACFAVLERLVGEGVVARDEHVVVVNPGAAQKYAECLPDDGPRLARGAAPDWDHL
jgi:threonine synthase